MSVAEKMKIREDLLAGRIPKRLFMRLVFTLEAACGIAGVELIKAHYDPEVKRKAILAVCDNFYSDTYPIENVRFPAVYQTLRAKNWVMSSAGMMQHPEIESFLVEDYDDYIANPYKTIMEKILPRTFEALNQDPISSGVALTKAYSIFQQTAAQEGAIIGEASTKYEYVPGFFVGGLAETPFDFLADQLRGFKAINVDVRRIPDKVEAAVNATLPMMMKLATPKVINPGHIVFIPLHLAPYMRPKDFERLYWPTFEKMVCELAEKGIQSFLFAEVDWTRYAEYLERLPENTIIQFENGDYKRIKEVLGKKQIFSGFFDPTITLTRSKDECLDVVKRMVDTCAPGGKFYFGFDRHIMDAKSIDIGKLQAVIEWVRDNTDY